MNWRHICLLAVLLSFAFSQDAAMRGSESSAEITSTSSPQTQTNTLSTPTLSAQTQLFWYYNPFDVDSMAYGATNDKLPTMDFPGEDGSPCKICEVDCMQRTDIFSYCHFRYFRYSCKRKQYCINTNNIAPGEYYGSIALCLAYAGCVLQPNNNNPATLELQNDLYKFQNPYLYCQTFSWWDFWGCVARLNEKQTAIVNRFTASEWNGYTDDPDWWREWLKHRALLASEDNNTGPQKLALGILPVQTISNGFYVYFKVVCDFKLNYDKGRFRGGDPEMRHFFRLMNSIHLERIPGQFRAAWKLYPLSEAQMGALIRQITTTGTTRFHQFYETMQGCLDEIEYAASANMYKKRAWWLGGWAAFYPTMVAVKDNCSNRYINLVRSWIGRLWNPYAEDLVYNIMLA